MAGHVHEWRFVDAPGRWTATCWCGLVVTVQAFGPDGGLWTWRLDDRPPSGDLLLESVTSVVRARLAREHARPDAVE